MIAPATKTCVHCNKDKPLSDYYPNKRTGYCIECYRTKEAARDRWKRGVGSESDYRAFLHPLTTHDPVYPELERERTDSRAWDRRMQRLDALAARIWRESGGLYGWPGPLDRPREMAFESPNRQQNTKEQCNV